MPGVCSRGVAALGHGRYVNVSAAACSALESCQIRLGIPRLASVTLYVVCPVSNTGPCKAGACRSPLRRTIRRACTMSGSLRGVTRCRRWSAGMRRRVPDGAEIGSVAQRVIADVGDEATSSAVWVRRRGGGVAVAMVRGGQLTDVQVARFSTRICR